jgi:hypothetical protein
MQLLTGYELDRFFKWKAGKAERLAKNHLLPHYILPDGKTIRFSEQEVLTALKHVAPASNKPGEHLPEVLA